MKVVLLAGGYGTRISEESHLKPKPMIEIGDMPMLWHIMKIYSHYGYNDFIICAGYKQHIIKKWFQDYYLYCSDITFDFANNNKVLVHNNVSEPWKVTVVDTGINTMTGGRIKRVRNYIGNESFLLTYGDGVSDINISNLVEYHKKNKRMATITAYKPTNRYGVIDISNDNCVTSFREKTKEDGGWINAGFMVLEPEIIDLIQDDTSIFERYPLEETARLGQLNAYKHEGFWQCMDTMRDKKLLEELWDNGEAPWKVWND